MDIKNQWFTVSNNHVIARLVFIFRLQNFHIKSKHVNQNKLKLKLYLISQFCKIESIVSVDKGNNKITELRTILQRESQNS